MQIPVTIRKADFDKIQCDADHSVCSLAEDRRLSSKIEKVGTTRDCRFEMSMSKTSVINARWRRYIAKWAGRAAKPLELRARPENYRSVSNTTIGI